MKLDTNKPSKNSEDEMELLKLLIDKWESENFNRIKMDPIQLINHLMEVHRLSRNDMIEILGIKRSALSQILSYQKGLSKSVIHKLSERFRLTQEAFNKEYALKIPANKKYKTEKVMNNRKKIIAA